MMTSRTKNLVLAGIAAASLSGCAAADATLNHSSLQVKTHMSESIFLDPVPEASKTVYISARNTSDHPEIDLRSSLSQAVQARGYRVVSDPNKAHFMLRLNVLQAGEIDTKTKDQVLMGSYGEPLLAGAGAAALTGALGGGGGAMAGVGLGIGLGSYLANTLIKDVTYSLTVDIQISERPLHGEKVHQTTANSTGGDSSSVNVSPITGTSVTASTNSGAMNVKTQNTHETKDFKQYQVRDMAYVDQVNLKFEDAVQPLVAKLTSSISNLLD